ncbi:unnamed protein product [Sphenostylis stenocarpa]|uniref:Uncharacterized protein n=1 Tax=Sphenostylis stenocarpa TaxID=92480 RepID=A0AA86S5W0_9FABA|nr:unnamed protein product [Sphenostylis stenocarpa]
MSWEGGRRSGLLGSTVKRMMFVHARLMKFDRVLLIGRYRRRHEKYDTKRGATRGLPRSTLKLRSYDGIRCISLGMIAPAKCCAINGYMDSTDTRLTCDA